MPTQITDLDILKEYIGGVMGRADHHAKNINEITLALVGAIVWKKDEEPVEVMAHKGEMKNVLWVKINGVRYAFSYNRHNKSVSMHRDSTHGMLIYSFSNQTPVSKIREVFESL